MVSKDVVRRRKRTKPAEEIDVIDVDDIVKMYVREAARVPLLTADEEVDLAQRIERGRMAQQELAKGGVSQHRIQELSKLIEDGNEAHDRLVHANSRLVISVAKKYMGRGLPFLDLVQEGNIGLMRAIKKYEYQRGFKFSTYATWWIRQAITRALADQGRTIRLPVHMGDQINRMMREQHKLQQDLGRQPSREELAEVLEVEPAKVDKMWQIVQQPLSLQSPVGEDEEEMLGDFIEDPDAFDPEESAAEALMHDDLQKRLEELPPRELRVLQLRYGLLTGEALTLNEVGRRLGITRERARQLESQAIRRLRTSPAAEQLFQPLAE